MIFDKKKLKKLDVAKYHVPLITVGSKINTEIYKKKKMFAYIEIEDV